MSTGWPIIIHTNFDKTDLIGILRAKSMKIRISDTIIPNTVIFPLSGVAFMIETANEQLLQSISNHSDDVIQRIDKFIQVHRNCYVLLRASLHGDVQKKLSSLLQHRYLSSSLQITPVHNTTDIVQAMLCIAKLLCKPTSDIMKRRFKSIMTERLITDSVDDFLKQLDFNQHQIQVTKDRLGSLSKMATASRDKLLDCSLDTDTVNRVLHFFNESK